MKSGIYRITKRSPGDLVFRLLEGEPWGNTSIEIHSTAKEFTPTVHSLLDKKSRKCMYQLLYEMTDIERHIVRPNPTHRTCLDHISTAQTNSFFRIDTQELLSKIPQISELYNRVHKIAIAAYPSERIEKIEQSEHGPYAAVVTSEIHTMDVHLDGRPLTSLLNLNPAPTWTLIGPRTLASKPIVTVETLLSHPDSVFLCVEPGQIALFSLTGNPHVNYWATSVSEPRLARRTIMDLNFNVRNAQSDHSVVTVTSSQDDKNGVYIKD